MTQHDHNPMIPEAEQASNPADGHKTTLEPGRSLDWDSVPAAVVRSKRPMSIIWLVPLVAVIIGAWLAYKAYSERGPVITISFKSAEGLEAGKTKIKFKEVEVGRVKFIDLNQDLSQVLVTAELAKNMESHLSENTRFWIVSARLSAEEVTGLSTIFSGAYIGMDPGPTGTPSRSFRGLEVPPIVTTDLPGRHFTLVASKRGSLDIGAPVYYRQNKVGQIVALQLTETGEAIRFEIFINTPYDKFVRQNTKFWNAGGLDVSLDANGLKINTESLISLVVGGVAFGSPPAIDPGEPAAEGAVFELFDSREKVDEIRYAKKYNYLINFSGSVRGLKVGAPVEFRGLRVGQVMDIKLELDRERESFRIPVLIAVEPDRVSLSKPSELDKLVGIDYLVKKGLRAQLLMDNLLTGQLYVALDFYPGEPEAHIKTGGTYPEIPAVPTPMEELSGNLKKAIDTMNKFPVQEIGQDLREAVKSLNRTAKQAEKLVANLDAHLVPQATATLKQAQGSLTSAQKVLASESPLQSDLRRTLKELSQAAQSLSVLVDYLDRHPEALIRGKGTEK